MTLRNALTMRRQPQTQSTLHTQVLFAGENARTAYRQALQRAQDMASRGIDPDAIWAETGWFQAPDRRWRYEINDRDAGEDGEWAPPGRDQRSEVSPLFFESLGRARNSREPQVLPLNDLFRHEELFNAYPELNDMHVQLVPRNYLTNERAAAQYAPALRALRINADDPANDDGPTAHKNILHELQHALQHNEDFAYGRAPGSPDRLGTGDPLVAYARRLGEAEARLVEERAGWPADTQRRTPPWADPFEPAARIEPQLDYLDPERNDWEDALTTDSSWRNSCISSRMSGLRETQGRRRGASNCEQSLCAGACSPRMVRWIEGAQ